MPESLNTWTVLRDDSLECPVCFQQIEVKILVDIRDTYAHIGSRTSFNASVVASAEAEARRVSINHECVIEKEKS